MYQQQPNVNININMGGGMPNQGGGMMGSMGSTGPTVVPQPVHKDPGPECCNLQSE